MFFPKKENQVALLRQRWTVKNVEEVGWSVGPI